MTYSSNMANLIIDDLNNKGFHKIYNGEMSTEMIAFIEETIGEIMLIKVDGIATVKLAEQQKISIEDYTEEGEGFDVTLNTYYHDFNGKQIDYRDKMIKNFKTLKGATNFANKQGLQIVTL